MKKRLTAVLLSLLLLAQGCSLRPEPPTETAEALPAAESAGALLPSPSPCPHEHWENGVCSSCGAVCPHPRWEDGVCTVCGFVCPHPRWEKGVCSVCGFVCPHEKHDRSGRCTLCGEHQRHSYHGGVCSVCGKPLEFEEEELPEELRKPCPEKGTLETLRYTTHNYVKEQYGGAAPDFEKEMTVYLPYGYDPSKKYDLLVLLHGLGNDELYWLGEEQEYGQWSGIMIRTADMLDQMIAAGDCAELIVAAPTFYADEDDMLSYDPQWDGRLFWPELRYDILPALVENYSTYAEDSSEAAMAAAREHMGYAGLSMGSIIAFQSVLPHCLDLFGWYGCFSGFGYDVPSLIREVAAEEEELGQEYPIYYLYNGCGTMDAAWQEHKLNYGIMLESWDKLREGENTCFTEVKYARHEFKGWIIGLYNCLQVFFPPDGAAAE